MHCIIEGRKYEVESFVKDNYKSAILYHISLNLLPKYYEYQILMELDLRRLYVIMVYDKGDPLPIIADEYLITEINGDDNTIYMTIMNKY